MPGDIIKNVCDGVWVAAELCVHIETKDRDSFGKTKTKTYRYEITNKMLQTFLDDIGKREEFFVRVNELLIAQKNAAKGWVYIFGVTGHPGVYKVGYTKNCPHERLEAVQNESRVPLPLEVKAAFWVSDPRRKEHECHKTLSGCRIHGEWFKDDYLTILDVVDSFTSDSERDWFE